MWNLPILFPGYLQRFFFKSWETALALLEPSQLEKIVRSWQLHFLFSRWLWSSLLCHQLDTGRAEETDMTCSSHPWESYGSFSTLLYKYLIKSNWLLIILHITFELKCFNILSCFSFSIEFLHIHDGHLCYCIQVFHHMWEACEFAVIFMIML